MPYHHLLLATDLSVHSKKIIKRALELSQQFNATLDLVHAIEHSPFAYGSEFFIPIDMNLEQTIESKAREALTSLCTEFNIEEKRRHLKSGSVKHVVIDVAKKIHADLILIGTHGHHGVDKLLGSRANAILHQASCDVLAIRIAI